MAIIKWITAICFSAIFSLPAAANTNPGNSITVYVAKKIITMDPAWPEATAVAIRDGKILSVGSLDDLKPWLDNYPHTIDKTFATKILMPGFIEPHAHPLIGGNRYVTAFIDLLTHPNPYGPAFPGVKTKAERWLC